MNFMLSAILCSVGLSLWLLVTILERRAIKKRALKRPEDAYERNNDIHKRIGFRRNIDD